MQGCRTVAEYKIKQWMVNNGFIMDEYTVTMDGNEATITDRSGGSLAVRYDPARRTVEEAD